MALVRGLASGYYTIETSGVEISPAVSDAIQTAFRVARDIPAEELRIRVADRSAERIASASASSATDSE